MKNIKVILFFIVTFVTTAKTEGDRLFNTDIRHTIKIELYKADDWDSIRFRFDVQNDSLTYTPVKITIDTTIFDSVGLSIKGNTGINPDISFKKYPYKIDMNEFKNGQKYDNVKKFNLNTKEFDNNIIMNNLFASFQLPYLRVSKAVVTMNSTTLGEYIIVEQVDKTYLKRTFGNSTGNLYKGDKQADLSYLGDDQKKYEDRYTLKTNDDQNNYSDLIHFIDVLNNVKEEKAQEDSLRNNFDINSYLKILSIQVTMGKIDDYYDKNHNYYLYHNMETKRFSFIPYDNDMIASRQMLFVGGSANLPLLKCIFTNQSLRSQYLSSMCEIFSEIELHIPDIGIKYNADYTSYKEKLAENIVDLKAEMEQAGYICSNVAIITESKNNKNRVLNESVSFQIKENKIYINTSVTAGKKYSLKMYSITGREYYSHKFQKTEENSRFIDVSFLQPGFYIAILKSTQSIKTAKIMVVSSCRY